ncbi:SsgA family sporulation/cell division regulator [Kitasatospora sp. NBC_00240]|uniref:SsgA family sporulation/cell division regulator n=1 Tax=Kitasatospora sp. NBC_00240 TaxID=2903567 RepID=UPI0022553376|nr:SsgA family sporulation/cell division regulator [Kitasatospora sp. NBC_00240]MCX5214174.1 SsgA family sporulation/cell division regulator [Kitasatospora sp. NBC_00240]
MNPHTNPPAEPPTDPAGTPFTDPGPTPATTPAPAPTGGFTDAPAIEHPRRGARVERSLPAHLAGPVPRTLRMVLRYDPRAPYEVSLSFPAPAVLAEGLVVEDGGRAEDGIVWTVARELLAEGLYKPAGLGDLRLRPVGAGLTRLEFYGDDGVALVHTDTAGLATFLDEAEESLPAGQEHHRIDWPETVEALLRYANRS